MNLLVDEYWSVADRVCGLKYKVSCFDRGIITTILQQLALPLEMHNQPFQHIARIFFRVTSSSGCSST